MRNHEPYILTAYGNAVAEGFRGTEKEWLKSMSQQDVPPIHQMYEECREMVGIFPPEEPVEQEDMSLLRILLYGSAAVIGILLRVIIKILS